LDIYSLFYSFICAWVTFGGVARVPRCKETFDLVLYLASEWPTQVSGPPHQLSAPCELLPIMAPLLNPN